MTVGGDTKDLAEVLDPSPSAFFQVLQQRYGLGENFTFLGHNILIFLSPPRIALKEYFDMVLKNRRVAEALAVINSKPKSSSSPEASISSATTPSMSPEVDADSRKSSPIARPSIGRHASLKIYDKKPAASSKTLRRANSQQLRRSKKSRQSTGITPQDLEAGGFAQLTRWKSFAGLSDLQVFIDDPKTWREYPHICGFMNMVYRRMVFEKRCLSFNPHLY